MTDLSTSQLPESAIEGHASSDWKGEFGGCVTIRDTGGCLFPPVVAVEPEGLDVRCIRVKRWDLLADVHPAEHICDTLIDGQICVAPWHRGVRCLEAWIVESGVRRTE